MSSSRMSETPPASAATRARASVVLPEPERPSSSTTGRSADAAMSPTSTSTSAGTVCGAAGAVESGKHELPAAERDGDGDRHRRNGTTDADHEQLARPERRGASPAPRDVGAEALRLHRGRELTATPHRDDEQGEGLTAEATDAAAVADPASAASEGELPPVLDEHTHEAERREAAEHEACGQAENLAQPIREVRGIGRREQHDAGEPYGENAQRDGHAERERALGDAHKTELPQRRALVAAVQHGCDARERRGDPERSGAHGELAEAESTPEEKHRFENEGDGRRDPVDREQECDAEGHRREELCDGVDPRDRRGGDDGRDDAHRATSAPVAPRKAEWAPSLGSRRSSTSASAFTNSASWVTATTELPASSSSARSATSSCQVRESCPKVGSSSTSTLGAVASTVATESRRFSPPERVNGLAPASASSRSRASNRSTRSVTSGS